MINPPGRNISERLPAELRLQVLEKLAAIDVVAVERVSRTWHAVAQEHWRTLKAPQLHRPYGTLPEFKSALCEYEAMVATLRSTPTLVSRAQCLQALARQRAYGACIVAAQLFTDREPDSPEVLHILARSYFATGQTQLGVEAVLQLAAGTVHAQESAAAVLFAGRRQLDDASAEHLLQKWPGDREVLSRLLQRLLKEDRGQPRPHKAAFIRAFVARHALPMEVNNQALCAAAAAGDLALVRVLAPFAAPAGMACALHDAVAAGALACAQHLYRCGGDPVPFYLNKPALMVALSKGRGEVALWLIAELGLDAKCCIAREDTAWRSLWEGCFNGLTAEDVQTILSLMEPFKGSLAHAWELGNPRPRAMVNGWGDDPTADFKSTAAFKVYYLWLLEHDTSQLEAATLQNILAWGDADILHALRTRLLTSTNPLHVVVGLRGDDAQVLPFIQALLEAGASVDVRDPSGNTPLHRCTTDARRQLLLEHGADPLAVNLRWQPALPSANLFCAVPRTLRMIDAEWSDSNSD